MINVLVFPCGSEIGLEIHSALKYAKDVRLYGASSTTDHGEFVYARYRQVDADTTSPDLVEHLNRLVSEWAIDVILPAHDSVIPILAFAGDRLAARAAVPPVDVASICRNKNLTYRRFADFSWVPRAIPEIDTAYPIFAKPAVGQGSNGAEIVRDASRHAYLRQLEEEYVFSEYLPGAECTIDCISDASGRLLHTSPRRRVRIKSGISVRTVPSERDSRLDAMAHSIAQALGLKGAWFFQARQDVEGQYKLLEIAPRIAGSMALSRNQGINYPLLTVYAYLEREFRLLPQTYPIVLERAYRNRFRIDLDYNHVYVDLDDTLLIRGQVNPLLIRLLYQWKARGIGISLVTRHNRCPQTTLASYHISRTLFDEVIHVVDGAPKSSVMGKYRHAIFIDDSFSERAEVSRHLGIPVFDLDSIEQLVDDRL